MKSYLNLIAVFSLLLFFGIANAQEPPQQGDGESELHIVIETHENASIAREDWSGTSPLDLGTFVRFGDIINTVDGEVKILCSDLIIRTVAGESPVICPRHIGVLVQNEQSVATILRTIEPPFIPFLISPRATSIMNPRPTIRWNTVEGASGYIITMRGENELWSVQIDDPEISQITYPQDEPPLEPEIPYTIEIEAIDLFAGVLSASSDEDEPGLSIWVVDSLEAEAIRLQEERIRSSIADEQMADFVVALLYTQNELMAEALPLLEGITGNICDTERRLESPLSKSPVVYSVLGDLFLSGGLENSAFVAFDESLSLAHETGNLEVQALASLNLARLEPNQDKALVHAFNAVEAYDEIGAHDQSQALRNEFNLEGVGNSSSETSSLLRTQICREN